MYSCWPVSIWRRFINAIDHNVQLLSGRGTGREGGLVDVRLMTVNLWFEEVLNCFPVLEA